MGNRLYVGNLSFAVTKESLTEMFSKAGTVTDANIITDRMSGQSRGFGFVEFETEEEATKAIDALNGQDLNGRALRVSKAQKMKPRTNNFSSGGQGGGYGGGGGGGGGSRFRR